MEYTGDLYGKIGKSYFNTGKTTEDWDSLEKAAKNFEPDRDYPIGDFHVFYSSETK